MSYPALLRQPKWVLQSASTDRPGPEQLTAQPDAENHLKKRGIVSAGDVYAITVGEPMGTPGGSNTLKLCKAA